MIEYISVQELKKNPKNPRIIKDTDFQKLKDSLSSAMGTQFFSARPCIVSRRTGENIIIAGNTRYQAAVDLGWEKVPVVYMPKNITEEQENEIIIRDNVNNGQWDFDELANAWDLSSLNDWGLSMIPKHTEQEEEDEKEHGVSQRPVCDACGQVIKK